MRGKNLIESLTLGVTGSSASYKAAKLVSLLSPWAKVNVILTPAAEKFVKKPLFWRPGVECYTESDWWQSKFLHLELKNVDAFVIAPCTVNTAMKLTTGIADNLLLATAVAFAGKIEKQEIYNPIYCALAANPNMLEAPMVKKRLKLQDGVAIKFIDSLTGKLACGDVGRGRMIEPEELAPFLLMNVNVNFGNLKEIKNYRVIVSGGATKAYIDSVRFITNSASGELARLLALAFAKAGFETVLVTTSRPLGLVKSVLVDTAKEMLSVVKNEWLGARNSQKNVIYVSSAAISDFTPKRYSKKIRKSEVEFPFKLELYPEVDVLKELFSIKGKKDFIVGFSLLDSIDSEALNVAKQKMRSKGMDLVVANIVSNMGAGEKKSYVAKLLFAENELEFYGEKLEFAPFLVNLLISKLFC